MLASLMSPRLVLVLSFTCSLLSTCVTAAVNPSLLAKRERVAAIRRQLGTYPITGPRTGLHSNGSFSNTTLPVRLEIRQLQQNTDQWNLYLLGLERLQAANQTELLSWYQICGIHGRPFVDWDGVGSAPGMQNSGYCPHESVLFPTWHRPYLSLYEQVLYEIIHRIVNEFNGTDQARYAQAAADFRIPYWDWAMAPEDNGTVLPASVSSSAEVEVMSPTGPRRIQNPLYQYTFHPFNANELPDSIVANWPSTIRYPSDRTSSAVSRHDLIEQQLRNNRLSLRDRLYNLFATYNNYTEFSNTAWFPNNGGNFDSVESVHDQIHGLLGNNGHMTWVDYSAFDPVFWLHHCMVDRLVAIWQVLNENSYLEPLPTRWGTYTMPRGTIEDVNTPLTPFHSDAVGTFWTSASARSVKTFSYTYPELVEGNFTTAELQDNVRAAINRLYGRTAPANLVRRRRRRDTGQPSVRGRDLQSVGEGKRLVGRANGTDPTEEETPDTLANEEGKYFEYVANILVKQKALNCTFFVHVFLGEFGAEPASWSFEPNLVGSHCVFTRAGKHCPCGKHGEDHDPFVTGAMPLTTGLLAAIKRGELASLDPKDVDPYLKENLHWRVSRADDTSVPNEEVRGLKISVISSEVKKPEREIDLPEWGGVSTREEVTKDKRTGLQPGEVI